MFTFFLFDVHSIITAAGFCSIFLEQCQWISEELLKVRNKVQIDQEAEEALKIACRQGNRVFHKLAGSPGILQIFLRKVKRSGCLVIRQRTAGDTRLSPSTTFTCQRN